MKNKKGFTVIELLVVVAIIGVLATVVMVNVRRNIDKANYTKTYADMTAIADAVKLYHAEEQKWPERWNTREDLTSTSYRASNPLTYDLIMTKLKGEIPKPPCTGAAYGFEPGYLAVVYFPGADDGIANSIGPSWAVAQLSIEGGGFPEIGSKPDKLITCKEYAESDFQ